MAFSLRGAAIVVLTALTVLTACEPDKRPAVSLEQARQITAEFQGQGFTPPPRTIGDITAILDQHKPDPQRAARARAAADEAPPAGANRAELASFYASRGEAARETGRVRQEIVDYREAVDHAVASNRETWRLLNSLGFAEIRAGNFTRGLSHLEESVKAVGDKRGALINRYASLARFAAMAGDLATADRYLAEAQVIFGETSRFRNADPQSRVAWQVGVAEAQGQVLDARGRYAEAEPHYRRAIAVLSAEPAYQDDGWKAGHFRWLARNLVRQGRLVEAEVEIRRSLIGILQKRGRYSAETANILRDFGRIVAEQGRYPEAEKLLRAVLDIYRQIGVTEESAQVAGAHVQLATALAFQERWADALVEIGAVDRLAKHDPSAAERFLTDNPDMAVILLRGGQTDAARAALERIYARAETQFGPRHGRTALMRGLLATALAAKGEHAAALAHFRAAIPILFQRSRSVDEESATTAARDLRLRIVLEGYMSLLSNIKNTPLGAQPGFDVVAEAFRIADAARGQSVQRALAASSARAAAKDPDLAELARREQDARKQVSALFALLTDIQSAPPDQQDAKTVAALRAQIDSLRDARAAIAEDIERRFPDYAQLIDPKPATIEQTRQSLRPGEALVATYVGADRIFVWAVPKDGAIAFATTAMPEKELAATVATLRKALDPNATTLGEIPIFDAGLAHRLYAALLKPVEAGWKDARNLLIVPHKELGQLPLSLLTTEPATLSPDAEGQALFANYKTMPWLARKVAVTQLPSVASLGTLRALPAADATRQAFIGFGDPWFSRQQAAEAQQAATRTQLAAVTTRGLIATRGVPLVRRNAPVTQTVDSAELAQLPRLPDTADEVKGVALALKADPVSDVILGRQANERTVKTMNLADRRVVMFATHGLVPGDLNGLTQPALALSAPEVADVDGDGLLTMDEILALKLNADWVVLSACNTATGEGAGAEAVSGLGRAFFYAGTRALLVSNWPVETISARTLTTDLFRRQAENAALGRAEALRQAMLGLIDGPGFVDPATGRSVFSYAHPIFWAPFSLVGDGGGGQPGA